MLHTAELEGNDDLNLMNIEQLIMDDACAVHSIHHTILGSCLGATTFGQDMLFDLQYLAD